jgi:uncharacterized cupredoxin-like copper-binding protein
VAALLVAGIPGCGGDDGGGNETTTAETNPGNETNNAGQSIDVFLRDFKIEPSNPTIDKTGRVELRVTNLGDTDHNLEVEGPKGESVLPSNLKPRQEKAMTVDFSKRGSYEWYCPVANHRQLGMEGHIQIGKRAGD